MNSVLQFDVREILKALLVWEYNLLYDLWHKNLCSEGHKNGMLKSLKTWNVSNNQEQQKLFLKVKFSAQEL